MHQRCLARTESQGKKTTGITLTLQHIYYILNFKILIFFRKIAIPAEKSQINKPQP